MPGCFAVFRAGAGAASPVWPIGVVAQRAIAVGPEVVACLRVDALPAVMHAEGFSDAEIARLRELGVIAG